MDVLCCLHRDQRRFNDRMHLKNVSMAVSGLYFDSIEAQMDDLKAVFGFALPGITAMKGKVL